MDMIKAISVITTCCTQTRATLARSSCGSKRNYLKATNDLMVCYY